MTASGPSPEAERPPPDAAEAPPGPVAVTGASGLIGSSLTASLAADGVEVRRLVRRPAEGRGDEVRWDPLAEYVDTDALEGVDAVVHLAGEPIDSRWTKRKKNRIYDSRVRGTRTLVQALATMARPPRVLVSASGIDYYGDRGDTPADETSGPGDSFLTRVAIDWEAAARGAEDAGIRTVITRNAMVLSAQGGALARLLRPFRLGIGGPFGSGQQWMSWVALVDVVRAIRFAIANDPLRGVINVVAPEPVRNREFAKALGRAVRRPAVIPVPAAALRLVFGEMAENTVLPSRRVYPKRLLEAGFEFQHPSLRTALAAALQDEG